MRRPIPSGKLIERIRKLRALSASNDSSTEAERAAAQALRLMREHAVPQAALDAAAAEREDPLVARKSYIDGLRLVPIEERSGLYAQTAGWKRSLAVEVSHYFGLQCSYASGTAIFVLYGHSSDVEAAAELYGTCARQIDRLCAEHLRAKAEAAREKYGGAAPHYWTPGDARTEGTSFRDSAVAGLTSKFEELTEESASAHAEPHALVLSRRAKVADWVSKTYTFKKSSSAEGFGGSTDFCDAGYAAGRRLDLHDRRALDAPEREVRALEGA